MAISLPPQLIAFGAALSYAISGIAARRGMRYSTPITVTFVSVAVHAATLWAAVLLTGGVPSVSWWVLLSLRSHRDASTYYPPVHLCRNFLCRRVARNNFAERSPALQHRVGNSVSRRTDQFSSDRWNTLNRGRDNLDFLAARKSASLISLVASRLSVGRRFPSWY